MKEKIHEQSVKSCRKEEMPMMKPQRELTPKEIRSIRKLVTTKCANHDNGIRIWISQQEGIFAYEQRPTPAELLLYQPTNRFN